MYKYRNNTTNHQNITGFFGGFKREKENSLYMEMKTNRTLVEMESDLQNGTYNLKN